MKIYVGIDISKLPPFAAVISSDDEIILQSFKFTNGVDSFQLLVSKLESFEKIRVIWKMLTDEVEFNFEIRDLYISIDRF